MFGVNIIYLYRFCGILQSLKNAYNALKDLKDICKDEIDDNFIKFCRNYDSNDFFLIQNETVDQAESLMNYFTCHKLILRGYNFDFSTNSLYSEIGNYFRGQSSRQVVPKSTLKLMHYILNHAETRISTKLLNDEKRLKKEDALEVFSKLSKMKCGHIFSENITGNNRSMKVFFKNSDYVGRKIGEKEISEIFDKIEDPDSNEKRKSVDERNDNDNNSIDVSQDCSLRETKKKKSCS